MSRYFEDKKLRFQVKVLHGVTTFNDDIGKTGELIHLDETEGIVRMDGSNYLKVFQLRFLASIPTYM